MYGSKTLHSWLQTGAIMKTSADQGESIFSSCVENEVDDSELSSSASGYLRTASEVKC